MHVNAPLCACALHDSKPNILVDITLPTFILVAAPENTNAIQGIKLLFCHDKDPKVGIPFQKKDKYQILIDTIDDMMIPKEVFLLKSGTSLSVEIKVLPPRGFS